MEPPMTKPFMDISLSVFRRKPAVSLGNQFCLSTDTCFSAAKKKQKENQKKQRESNLELKEYRLSVAIDIHDFNTRIKNARKSLEKGDKVKASIKFKGRQISHPELGKEVLVRFSNELSDIAEIEIQPKMEGKSMFLQLTPKK